MHTTPNGKRYIWLSGNIKDRWNNNGNRYKEHKHFYNAIKKYGWNNIIHETVFENLNLEDANSIEQILIILFRTHLDEFGYNKTFGGGGKSGYRASNDTRSKISQKAIGRKASTETIAKMSLAHIGNTNLLGHKQTDESKKKISESVKNKLKETEIRKRMSERSKNNKNFLGHRHTDETKKKMAESHTGVNPTVEARANMCNAQTVFRDVYQYSINGELLNIFESLRSAEKYINPNRRPVCVSACVNGRNKTAYGYKWSYI